MDPHGALQQGRRHSTRHSHACNQFMYCISGAYLYKSSGLLLRAADLYFNPKGSEHGPTEALEDAVPL